MTRHFAGVVSAPVRRVAALAVAVWLAGCATITPDYAREQRLADEVVPGLMVGDAVRLRTATQRTFLGIFAEAQKSRGALLLVHGSGVHPDFAIIGQLRSLLNDAGFTTLSIQMPVLAANASGDDYPPLFGEAGERIEAALQFLHERKHPRIALVTHSMGARMALSYLRKKPDAPLAAWVPLAIADGDLSGLPSTRFPVFDVYAERDFPVVMAKREARAAMLRRQPGSRQVMVYDTDHFFAGKEKELALLLADLLAPTLK